jgi:hypothetical protein
MFQEFYCAAALRPFRVLAGTIGVTMAWPLKNFHGLCGLRDLSAAGPDGLATTAAEAEAPALMFSRWL